MPEDPLNSSLQTTIEVWLWGKSIRGHDLLTPQAFRAHASRLGIPIAPSSQWFDDPINWDSPDESAVRFHPFRVYDCETGRRNLGTLLAIAADPISYVAIHGFRRVRFAPNDLFATASESGDPTGKIPAHEVLRTIELRHEAVLTEYSDVLNGVFQEIGEEVIQAERANLGDRAHSLEPNVTVVRLCRLMNDQERRALRGRTAHAVFLLEMAESIRRVAESAFDKKFPEEDAIYPIGRIEQSKVTACGTNRLFDDRQARHRLVRSYGLDFGIRAVCYVEGATEYGALRHLFPEDGPISIVDLHGQGSTPRLQDLLREHQRDRVFSAMVLDGDREDRIREARLLAEDNLLSLGFAVSEPDFEYGVDATDTDRLEALRRLWIERSPDVEFPAGAIQEGMPACETAQELEAMLQTHHFSFKGARWGELFCEQVRSHSEPHVNHPMPFWDLVYRLSQAQSRRFVYEHTTESMKVDPSTGYLVHRE